MTSNNMRHKQSPHGPWARCVVGAIGTDLCQHNQVDDPKVIVSIVAHFHSDVLRLPSTLDSGRLHFGVIPPVAPLVHVRTTASMCSRYACRIRDANPRCVYVRTYVGSETPTDMSVESMCPLSHECTYRIHNAGSPASSGISLANANDMPDGSGAPTMLLLLIATM